MIRFLRRACLHPFLAAAYPILAMLAANLGQVRPTVVYRPLILSLLVTGVLFAALGLLIKYWTKAGVLTTWWIVLFFAYGHVYNAARTFEVAGSSFGRHRFLVPLWILLGLGGLWLVVRRQQASQEWTLGLNLALATAVVLPLGQIAWSQLGADAVLASENAADAPFGQLSTGSMGADALPDVYYIVLDAYARADTLRETYGYDNSAFLDKLRRMGFYVAECSQANYAQTELSLAAALNGAYLEDLVEGPLKSEVDRKRLWPFIRQSAARRTLEGLGYTTIAFETGYYWSELEDADVYLAPMKGLLAGMTAFEGTLVRSTAAWAIIDASTLVSRALLPDLDQSTNAHRRRVQFVFDELGRMPERPGPKFVFAHIVSPHRPFVFDAEGNPVDDDYDWTKGEIGMDAYAVGYTQQLTYLNRRLEKILDTILANSQPPPVILLQSDHGPEFGSSNDRMRILNAYYLGETGSDSLYSGISPVNSFRHVFHQRYGSSIPLLEDTSYFSTYNDPFDYMNVENSCSS